MGSDSASREDPRRLSLTLPGEWDLWRNLGGWGERGGRELPNKFLGESPVLSGLLTFLKRGAPLLEVQTPAPQGATTTSQENSWLREYCLTLPYA